jgi:hypothetical protein
MTLALIAPGTRHGNKSWLIRGRHDGRVLEIATQTTDRARAEEFLRNSAARARRRRIAEPEQGVRIARITSASGQARAR